MELKVLIALQSAGVDTEGALRRFAGNSALYERFLLRFPADENFDKIGEAMEAGDWEAMLAAAHTLKGVSGNLGMNRLFEACSRTVALLRQDDVAGAKESYQALKESYSKICAVLKQIEEG